MSHELSTELIRWTFTAKPEARAEIESYLNDQGLDVFVHGESGFSVSWDDPDLDADPIVEAIWEINGEPFDITQEAFHRLSLLVLHADDAEGLEAAA